MKTGDPVRAAVELETPPAKSACVDSSENDDGLRRRRGRGSAGEEPQARRPLRSSHQQVDLKKCIVCQVAKADRHNRRLPEALTQCSTFECASSLLNAARVRGDTDVLREIEGCDLIAKEILYHRSCFSNYTRKNTLEKKLAELVQEENDGGTGTAHLATFEKLAAHVESTLLGCSTEVTSLSKLCSVYRGWLLEEGVEEPNAQCRSYVLKARIKSHFGERLTFHRPTRRNESELVFSADAPCRPIIERWLKAEKELEETATLEDLDDPGLLASEAAPMSERAGSDLYHAAVFLRGLIRSIPRSAQRNTPVNTDDLDCRRADKFVPDLLYNFLLWVVQGPGDLGLPTEERVAASSAAVDRRVLSIAQDLIFSSTDGRVMPPKHTALAMSVRHLTGSSKVVTLLNRFGHSCSVSHAMEIECALAETRLQEQAREEVYIPPSIKFGAWVSFAWDNNDLCEDTLSGSGTTHCTNGIVVQRCVQGPSLEPTRLARVRHRRSLHVGFEQCEPYNAGARGTPPLLFVDTGRITEPLQVHEPFLKQDFLWSLARFGSTCPEHSLFRMTESQVVPGWTAFNAMMDADDPPVSSTVGYCPVIGAPPTEMATVYTLLLRSVDMARRLEQQDAVIVLDQAIYAKAKEILWKRDEQFRDVVLRMGAFHILCVMCAVIGKRFGDAGLRDLLVESRVVAQGSVNGVLAGKHYNRAIRTHKVVMEALQRVLWQRFGDWCQGKDHTFNDKALQEALVRLRREQTAENLQAVFASNDFCKLFDAYQEFRKQLVSPSAQFWLSYIDLVQLLLYFMRSTREAGKPDRRKLHVDCLREMLPWCFAYDRTHYSRYLSLYWCDMSNLSATHPAAFDAMARGEFGVQRSIGTAFAQVPVDQTIEQTINRHSKCQGGIVGFSTRDHTVQRWVLTAYDRANILASTQQMAGMLVDDVALPKECQSTRFAKDEEDVCRVLEVLGSWVDPFAVDATSLASLASGVTAPPDVSTDLLSAHEKGTSALKAFIETRLVSLDVAFFDPLPKLGLKTFSSLNAKKVVRLSSKEVVLRADRKLFARLVVIAQGRQLDMREVLKFSLGPLPWSLAAPDRSLAKTNKAKMLALLESGTDPVETMMPSAVCIIDGMALLQCLKPSAKTFEDLASDVLEAIMLPVRRDGTNRVDFVTDQYPIVSIKNVERQRRSQRGVLQVQVTGCLQSCPRQWQESLSLSSNKTALIKFLVSEWKKDKYAPKLKDCMLYVTDEQTCISLKSWNNTMTCQMVDALQCDQEEADTRMLLHAAHAAASGHAAVIIRSPDTDVAVLGCSVAEQIPARLMFRTGTQHRSRLINLTAISQKLGQEVCQALPGLHAFTGCDTTSAFSGRGKKTAFSLTTSKPAFCNTMRRIGASFDASGDDDLLSAVEKCVCALYGKPSFSSVEELRYHLFCVRASQSSQLPPTRDALKKHLSRAAYQAAIWRRSLNGMQQVPSPVGHGWCMGSDGQLAIDWMDRLPAPQEVLELVSCGCERGCGTGRCSCRSSGLSCTDVCMCSDCSNLPDQESEDEDNSPVIEADDDDN